MPSKTSVSKPLPASRRDKRSSGGKWDFVREVFGEWRGHKASRWAAMVAYHTIFSLAPVLIIAIAVAGLVFGDDRARLEVIAQAAQFSGENGGATVEALLKGFQDKERSASAVALGTLVLLWGASNVFVSLRESLNHLWDLRRKPGVGLKGFAKERLASFALVLGVGFVLLVSLFLSAVLSAFRASLSQWLTLPVILLGTLDILLSFVVVGLLFTLIFKFLPSALLSWRDAAAGAMVSAVLFILGKSLLGYYLGKSAAASAYGAAGSVVLILLWVNYSTQALFVGASVIKTRGSRNGRPPQPGPYAEVITCELPDISRGGAA